MLAKEIMVKDVITVKKDDTIQYVTKLLMDHNVSGFPVVDEENHVVGIVTEGDLIYKSKKLDMPSYFTLLDSYIFLEDTKKLEDQIKKMVAYKVEDVMTKKALVVDQEENVEVIASIMTSKKINRVPIVKDDKLVGIVSRRDIIKAFANE